jgi:hypothetical protein
METYAYKQMFYSYKTIKALITRKKEFKADDNYVINILGRFVPIRTQLEHVIDHDTVLPIEYTNEEKEAIEFITGVMEEFAMKRTKRTLYAGVI